MGQLLQKYRELIFSKLTINMDDSIYLMNQPTDTLSYEQAFQRLEAILEEMNSRDIQLERSLELFEEADKLMKTCQEKLNNAEKRVEIILKGKNGAPLLDKNGNAEVEPFQVGKQ